MQSIRRFGAELGAVYLALLKVMVPAIIVVKLLDMAGATAVLASVLGPLMQLVGLPESMGIVWATAMLTNIYTGMIVFVDQSAQQALSVAQVTVLGTMILVAHSLPVEGAVAKALGVGWGVTLSLRIGGALALGALLNLGYQFTHTLQQPSRLLWQPATTTDHSLLAWAIDQLQLLLLVLVAIATLMALLRALRAVGIERLMHWLLAPLLRLIGIRREAASITIIGTTLGLSYGAGLLIQEGRSGQLTRRDIFLTMGFLGLCHSIIEDTLLILALGADLSGILWARLGFAVVVIAVLARLLKADDDEENTTKPSRSPDEAKRNPGIGA